MERINKILHAENNIKEVAAPKQIEALNESIQLEHVHFSYNEGHEILHDINLTIKKGQTIALVGHLSTSFHAITMSLQVPSRLTEKMCATSLSIRCAA